MYLNNYTYVTILHSVLAERILYDITVSDAIAMITLTWQYPHFASSFCLFSQLLLDRHEISHRLKFLLQLFLGVGEGFLDGGGAALPKK